MNEDGNNVSIYGEGAIVGNVDDAALAAKAEANGVTISDGGENIPVEPQVEPTVEQDDTPPAEKPADSPIEEKVANNKATEDALEKDLSDKGVDFSKAVSEYNETGNLSAETMEALAKAGYPKEVVEGFIQSRQVLETQYTNAVFEAAGGETEYSKLTSWAAQNLSKGEIDAFNSAVDSGNLSTVKLLMGGIKSAMGVSQTSKHGTKNPSVIGGPATASTGGFADKAEMVKAMGDKRYARDPQYTREVEAKVAKTTWL